MEPVTGSWKDFTTIKVKVLICGHCNERGSFNSGYLFSNTGGTPVQFIYICHNCNKVNFIDYAGKQYPGSPYGNSVSDITDKTVNDIYEEARRCTSASAYTAAVLCCRKLLMHIAVDKGADENDTFKNYVQYLADNHYAPPGSEPWVTHIKDKGNDANHEIIIMKPDDAKELIAFSEMLLKFIYEFPAKVKPKPPASSSASP